MGKVTEMLATLRQYHQAIGTLLTALEALCQDQQPDMEKISAVRLELTRASRARSAYLNATVYPQVMRAAPDQRIALEKLKSDGILMLVRSGDHIRHWTPRQIAADWSGYCSASKLARATMRSRIELEAKLLYPLLKEGSARQLPRS